MVLGNSRRICCCRFRYEQPFMIYGQMEECIITFIHLKTPSDMIQLTPLGYFLHYGRLDAFLNTVWNIISRDHLLKQENASFFLSSLLRFKLFSWRLFRYYSFIPPAPPKFYPTFFLYNFILHSLSFSLFFSLKEKTKTKVKNQNNLNPNKGNIPNKTNHGTFWCWSATLEHEGYWGYGWYIQCHSIREN